MATVQQVYDLLAADLLEDSGLVLGLVTNQQFIDLLNLVTLDFIRQTCPYSQIYTESVLAGFSQHVIPTNTDSLGYTYQHQMMRVDLAFLAGRLIEQSTVDNLNRDYRGWRYNQTQPVRWHSDQLPLQTMETAPVPNYNSTYIPGPNEPDPPHGQFGDWSITVLGSAIPPNIHEGLTMVGPELPEPITALGDTIPLMDDDIALAALGFGVLERIFSGDNEMKNDQAALFCHAQYAESVAVWQAITSEPGVNE